MSNLRRNHPILGPLFLLFVGNAAVGTIQHVLTHKHRPKVGEAVWFAKKQLEGEITWVEPNNQASFVFGTGTPVKPNLRFRYYSTCYTRDVVYDKTLHAWLVGEGRVPDSLRKGTIIRPDPVEVRLLIQGRQ